MGDDRVKYRLIIADLDGTLKSESKPTFTPRVLHAVARARARGVRVVLATGRMYRTAQPFIRDLGLTEPAILSHGASIRDLQTGQVLFERRIPLNLVLEVAQVAWDRYTLTACADGEMFTNRILENEPGRVGDIPVQDHLHRISDFRELEREPEKLLFLNDDATTQIVFGEMKARFDNRLQVVRASPRRVELTHREASKGIAAAWLGARWVIERQEVIAIGDQDNDRSMIEWAGLGIAMGNAIDEIKSISDLVAPSAEEDGAAQVIERFVLS